MEETTDTLRNKIQEQETGKGAVIWDWSVSLKKPKALTCSFLENWLSKVLGDTSTPTRVIECAHRVGQINMSRHPGQLLLSFWTKRTLKIHLEHPEDRGRCATITSGSASSPIYQLEHDSITVYLMAWRQGSAPWKSAIGFSILLTWSSLMRSDDHEELS